MSRLQSLPPYLFSSLDAAKAKARAAGVDVVDLGIGDPDLPTPPSLLDAMASAVRNPSHHRYPAQRGGAILRSAIADYMARRHGVTVDPSGEVLVLLGSKEGLGHLPLALLEEGDVALVPDLGYPVYAQGTLLAGGEPRTFGLKPENGFLPDLSTLPGLFDERVRLVFMNYPNNPTGSVATPAFWSAAAELCGEAGAVLVNDAAYLEVTLDGSRPVSMLASADHRTRRVIELHSLSKMFNMTGWRVAFAVGNAGVIADLGRVKESMDSGVFGAIQETAALALGPDCESLLAGVMAPYAVRRDVIVAALADAGFEVFPSPATFYIWVRVPAGEGSVAFCSRALEEIGLVITPGVGFGPGGEGWFRISLTAPDERIAEGARRLKEWR
ncbi:MAG: aminotransferase class I/II-fold pyridoxal phosphate-dependent enzyme [bacterium]